MTGGREKEVRVAVDRYRLEAFGVSLAMLESRLASENVDIAAGTLEEDERIFQVRGLSRFRTPADVANVVVRYLDDPSGQRNSRKAIRVADLGTVELVDAEIDHLVLVNGAEGVGLAVYKEAGSNTVGVSAAVQDALAGLHEDLPGVDVHEVANDAGLVTDALDDLKIAAGAGIVLAVLVLAIFLRSAGATLIVAASVPVSGVHGAVLHDVRGPQPEHRHAGWAGARCRHAGGQRHCPWSSPCTAGWALATRRWTPPPRVPGRWPARLSPVRSPPAWSSCPVLFVQGLAGAADRRHSVHRRRLATGVAGGRRVPDSGLGSLVPAGAVRGRQRSRSRYRDLGRACAARPGGLGWTAAAHAGDGCAHRYGARGWGGNAVGGSGLGVVGAV